MKGSTFHPSLLLMAEFTLDSDNDNNLTTKTPVNREIYYQDLLLILDSELTTTANMNCHQLSGTETGFLGNLRQTEPTTSPLPHSPSSPPSISLPWLSPPPISPVSRLTPTITSKTSTTAVTSSTLYLDSGPIQSQVKAVEDTYNVAGRGAADAVLKGDYVDDSDDDGDDDEVDVENVGSGGGTGYRNGKKNIRRGSKSNYSLKKAASLDDEFKLTTNINGSSSSRVETAPSRNQSEEESYITRSELENISCKVDQLQSASNTTLTKVSVSPATNTKQSQSKSSSASSSDLTVLSSTISDDDDSCEQITATTSTAATAKLLNNDIDVNKFSLQPYISDSFNGLIQVSSSSPSSDKCLKSSHFSSFSYNNNQERNLLNSGLLVRSSFPSSFSSSSSSVDCDYNDDQGEPINCHSKSSNDDSTTCSYNSTIYNNSQPTSQQLSAVLKSDDQLFLLTCLPIQPTVNNYKQLSLNNLNSNNQNSTNANHNPKVRSPTTTTTTSDFSSDLTLLKVKEVNYDYDYSVDLRLVAASNHQHNNIQKIKPSSADWIKTATRKTSKTSINSTRVDKLSQFSSLLLSSPPTTSVLLSSSPSGLSSTNHQHNHPVILTLCFKHLWNSIVDNLVNQIVPGFLNADNNHNDGDIQTREFLTTCYTKPTTQNYIYLDLPKLPPYLASYQFAIVDDIIKNDYCLTHNQSSSNNNSLDTSNLIKYNTNSENQGYLIKSQYSSSSSLNILSPTIQFPGKPEVIDGNCNIVSLEKSVSSPSSSASFPSSFMKNQQWSITRSTPESQSSSSFTQESSSPSVNIENNIAGDEVLRLDDQYCNSSNQEHEDEESESMSLYTTNKGHTSDMKSNSSTSSSSSSSSLSSGLLNNLTHHQPQSDDDDDDEEYIVDEDGDGSTSSDESFPPPILPNQSIGGIYSGFGGVGGNSNYGNPLAYSLHTIVEESCEESEPESLLSRISETNGHLNGDDPSGNISTKGGDGRLMMIPHHSSSSSTSVDPDGDLSDPENYTAFQIGRNTLTRQRDSFAESEIGTEYSEYDEEEDDDDMSETSETIADFGDDDEMDPITLASSRLEKYFTSGLLGSGAYDYPDDVEFQDDDPDDLYNQAKRDSIKVEIKLNNNVKSDDTKCDNNVNTNHNNHSPNTNNNNIKNIQFNGIYLIPESNVISSIEPTTTLPITTLSTSSTSTSTSTSTTISSSSSLSTQSVTITTQPSPSPSPLPPTTVSNTTKLKSKGPAPQPPTPLSTTVNINHVEDDYFSDAVKRKPSNNNDNQSKPDENESTESTTITKSRYNKEINESQISHITVLSNIMEESSQSNVVATSNHIDNDSSTGASKEKETFIKSIIINDTNEIDDDRDDDNHLMKNVSIEVRTLSSPPPPPPIVNNLITDNNNTKSVSSIAINNCNNTTKSTRNRMDLNHQSSLSAVTKSNYNESSDIIESVVSKKETTKTTVSTSTPISTTTPSMVTKPSLESTTIRFGPSPQLVRSLLADEKSTNRRLVTRKRVMLGGSEPCPSNESTSAVPHISVSDYSESFSHRGSFGSSGEEIFISTEDDIDKAFAFHNRSHQTSLSSFGARSESLSSVYSAAGGGRYGTVAVSGEILFSISYSQSEGSLELYIKECRNLSPVDAKRNRSDPYVKLYLLPDRSKSGKRKTKVKKHTLNPIFDESLKFYLPSNQKEGRTLWISVWHSDIFGRNDFLGEVTLPLTKEILRNSGLRWYPLQERIDLLESTTHNYKGDIFIALKFVPSESSPLKGSNNKNGLQGKLLVLVKEAHNLMPTRSNGTSDPFVKCYLLPDKSKKHKTPVIKKTVNPRWNHTFEFDDVTTNELKDRCLELTVWDYDKLTSNDFLGGVRLSLGQGIYEGKPVDWLDSSEEEMILWKQMLDRTDMWVYGELRLRSSLQSRTQTATVLR